MTIDYCRDFKLLDLVTSRNVRWIWKSTSDNAYSKGSLPKAF